MDRSRRVRLATLTVSALVIALCVAFVWLHLSTPSDGARLQPGQPGWSRDGVAVTLLRAEPGGLRTGDVVVAVDGRSMESWAQALFRPGHSHLLPGRDETVVYTVLRRRQAQPGDHFEQVLGHRLDPSGPGGGDHGVGLLSCRASTAPGADGIGELHEHMSLYR